jgi:hypothetical protein
LRLDAASSVSVAGAFNAWSASTATPLSWNAAACAFEGRVALPPGRSEFKFIVDGAWTLSAEYPRETDGSGNENNYAILGGGGPRAANDWLLVPLLRAAGAPRAALASARVWSDVIPGLVDQGDVAGAWLSAVAVDDADAEEREEYGNGSLRLLFIDGASARAARPLTNRYMPASSAINPSSGARLAAALGGEFLAALIRGALLPLWTAASGGAFASRTSFADGFPLLLASEASLADLNERLESRGAPTLDMGRFRPNVVVRAAPGVAAPAPWAEDSWAEMEVRPSQLRLRGVKRCSRCSVTTTNQVTGVVPGAAALSSESAASEESVVREPLATLRTFRTGAPPHQDDVYFGVNLLHDSGLGGGREARTIRVGDSLAVATVQSIPPF